MGKIIDKYKASGNLVLDLNFAKGSLLDQSGNGNHATATGGSFVATPHGYGYKTTGTDKLTVTDAASLDATDFTIVAFYGRPFNKEAATTSSRIGGVKGTAWDFYHTTSNKLFLTINGTDSSLDYTIAGNRMFAVRQASGGAKPTFFVDGVYKGEGSAALTTVTNSTAATLLNYSSAADGYSTHNPCCRFLIFNVSTITNQEISQLYDELMAEYGPLKQPSTNFTASAPTVDASCALAYDFSTRGADGKFVDLSGNGKNGTVTNAITSCRMSNGFDGAKFNATGNATFSNTTMGTAYTFELVFENMPTEGLLFGNGTSYALYYSAFGPTIYHANGTTNQSWTVTLNSGPHHIIIDRDGTSVTLYVDGVSLGTKTLANNDALSGITTITNPTFPLTNAKIAYFHAYTVSKGAAWAALRYLQYAKNCVFRQNMADVPVTPANVTAGYVPYGDWQALTGTWSVSQDTASPYQKWLNCVSAGVAFAKSTKAYGTFVFDVYKGADANAPDLMLIASVAGTASATGQNGYGVRITDAEALQVIESTSGTPAARMSSAASYVANTTKYRICMTRNYAGAFRLYVKGGVYSVWTLMSVSGGSGTNPVTDTTTTSSYYVCADLDAGDKVSNMHFLDGVIDPTANPELIPL